MLVWALIFLAVGMAGALLGFTSVAGGAVAAAKILFYVCLLLFLVTLVMHLVRGRTP